MKHPIYGAAGSKPRVPGGGNGAPVTKEQLAALNHSYLEARNRAQLAKAQSAEMSLQERTGTLVQKRQVALECAFLLSAFRQSLLTAPAAMAREMAAAGVCAPGQEHALERGLFEKFSNLLRELANLPARLADPNWCTKIDSDLRAQVDGAKEGFAVAPNIATAKAAKAKAQHDKKITAQRHRREGRG